MTKTEIQHLNIYVIPGFITGSNPAYPINILLIINPFTNQNHLL